MLCWHPSARNSFLQIHIYKARTFLRLNRNPRLLASCWTPSCSGSGSAPGSCTCQPPAGTETAHVSHENVETFNNWTPRGAKMKTTRQDIDGRRPVGGEGGWTINLTTDSLHSTSKVVLVPHRTSWSFGSTCPQETSDLGTSILTTAPQEVQVESWSTTQKPDKNFNSEDLRFETWRARCLCLVRDHKLVQNTKHFESKFMGVCACSDRPCLETRKKPRTHR